MNPYVALGGIASARGTEDQFLMFAALMQAQGTPRFNTFVSSLKDTHEHA